MSSKDLHDPDLDDEVVDLSKPSNQSVHSVRVPVDHSVLHVLNQVCRHKRLYKWLLGVWTWPSANVLRTQTISTSLVHLRAPTTLT